MKNIVALALLSSSVLSLSAFTTAEARWHGRNINQRQYNQENRILQGAGSGSLTRHEARNLQHRENNLAREEQRMRRSGGGLSHHERAVLNRQENHLSRSIYHQKHDGQFR